MKRYGLLLGGLIFGASQILIASEMATATYTDSLVSPGEYQYDLTLDNIGTTTIGTFWFGWVPGDNFMPVSPTDVASPTGWQDIITSGGPSGGFAVQFTANAPSDDLAAGSSLSGFEFDSTLTPTELMGIAKDTSDPITTAFIYSGAPFSDAGFQLTATQATPEPSTMLVTALGFALIVGGSFALRKRKKAPLRPASSH